MFFNSYFYIVRALLISFFAFSSFSFTQDSYQFLEDSENPQTKEWLEKQQALFNTHMQANPYRADNLTRLQALTQYDMYSIPVKSGKYVMFERRKPSEDQYVLYVQEGLEGSPRVLIDPNTLSQNAPVSLVDCEPSHDSKFLAYGLAENGSDWVTWHVLHIDTGEPTDDILKQIKFTSVVWSPDSQGFYYARFDSEHVERVYYHRIGTEQSEDKLVYGEEDQPNVFYILCLSSDKRYVLISMQKGASAPNAYCALDVQDHSIIEIIPYDGANYSFVSNQGSQFYFVTDKDAPFRKLVSIDINKKPCQLEHTILPEGTCLLDKIVPVGKYFLVSYLDNVCSRLELYDREGKWVRNIALPHQELGIVTLSKNEDEDAEDTFFSFTNFLRPEGIYRYNVQSDTVETFKEPTIPFQADDFVVQQVFYSSKDGTRIPLFIVHKKGIQLDGNNPTLLYGYGGFRIPVYPAYSGFNLRWMEQGGVYALANIRGGCEYGESWHQAGMRHNKQNCFDDFIAAAEWLVANKYTKPSKLAIRGRSNGGLLVAACLNQRPDLFGAASVEVGVLDMLRFHLFTVGHAWISEYGNPDNPSDRAILAKYSPYHTIKKEASYPPTLVVTADHDDRVVPLHSYKYTAALQQAQPDNPNILLRLDTQSGHGAGKPISKWIEESADVLSFILQALQDD